MLSETTKGNLEYIATLLNGDDYFGKFLLRTILGKKVTTRCDAGIGRFSLAPDGCIYVCPGAIDIEELVIGSLEDGINYDVRDKFWEHLTKRVRCEDCFARFVCGGECMVSSYYAANVIYKVDDVMCELKKFLYKLSLLFYKFIYQTNNFEQIHKACIEKNKRFEEDIRFSKILDDNPDVSFMELKMNNELKSRLEEKNEKIRSVSFLCFIIFCT